MTEYVPLSSMVEEIQSGFACGDSVDAGVVQLRMNNVDTEGRIDLTAKRRVPIGAVKSIEKYVLTEGDVMFNNTNSPELVGKSAVFRGFGEPVVFSNHFTRIRVKRECLEPRFLARWLASEWSKGRFASMCNQWVNQASVRKDSLLALQLPRVAVDEQRRIADILDKADAIRRKRKEAIALTEELLRSAFLEMFGDPVTNPKGWPSETIAEVCSRGASLVDGPFGSSLKPEHYVDSGAKVVRNWNIYDDRFDAAEFKYVTMTKFEELRRSEVLPGDVLITTKGTVGDVCVAPDLGAPALLSASGTVRLRVPLDATYTPEFVVAQMTTPTYKRYLHTFEAGSAQQYLNLSAIRKMRLIRPPLDRQRNFGELRARLRSAGERASAAQTESNRLFGSLVERAFATGH